MTKQQRVMQAIENMINELGQLRNDGVPADAWHKHMHDLRSAAWNAYYEQQKIVAEQNAA